MVSSILFYFLLPLGAAYAPGLFAKRVFGPVNMGILFALLQFLVAWGVAFVYAGRANAEVDRMSAELIRDAEKIGGRK